MPESSIERLVARLSAYHPTDRTADADLALVRAIVAGEVRREAEAAGTDDQELAALDAEIARRLGDGVPAPDGLLIEREPGLGLTIPFPGLADPVPELTNARALGAFLTETGARRRLLLALTQTWDTATPDGSEVPAFFAPAGGMARNGDRVEVAFEDGTLWIRAGLLVEDLPDEVAERAFVGLPGSATEGAFRAEGADTGLASPLEGRITIRLRFPADLQKVCPGISITAPQELSLIWDGSSQVTAELSAGAIEFEGERIELQPNGGLRYDAEHRRLVLSADASSGAIDAAAFFHRFAKLEGSLTIDRAGWGLPVMMLPPSGGLPALAPVGGWVFDLTGEVEARWEGLDGAGRMEDPWLEIALDGWRFDGPARAPGARFDLSGWALEGGRQPLGLALAESGRMAFGCDRTNGDFAAFTAGLEATLSCPVDIAGRPIALGASEQSAVITEGADDVRRITLSVLSSSSGPAAHFALENALVLARNIEIARLEGVLEAPARLGSGRLRLRMLAVAWMPILPDPYVANTEPRLLRQRPVEIVAEVIWSDAKVSVAFSGGLETEGLEPLPPSDRRTIPTDIDPGQLRRDGQTMSGRETRTKEAETELRREIAIAEDFQGAPISREGEDIWIGRAREFDDGRVRLLDVSTRRDQIGVALNVDARRGAGPFRLSGMRAITELSDLRVFALPQIQWEPVRTLDKDQDLITLGYFPTPLASPDDGGATQIASPAARLVPAIPDLTVDAMISAFGEGAPLRMVTTLPFGIKALMQLRPAESSEKRADRVRRVEPSFKDPDLLVGGLQLAIEAGPAKADPPVADPGFEGWSYQLPNGVDLATGAPRFISVLGSTKGPDASVEALFNSEFLFSRPKVPLTRLDVSGYGASTFSDWRNPSAAFAEAAKVEFQVLVGRTALEVVKFVSVIYPWGIRVTRSVTIERGGGAGVVRRDSGWQATSDGLLDFRWTPEGAPGPVDSPYAIHPGLIRGLHDVRRIRPADRGRINLPDGGAVQPMYFDAEIALGLGEDPVRTRSKGVLGFLHLEPVCEPITPDDLEALLTLMGPAGGPVDVALELRDPATSAPDEPGLACRIVRAEIGTAREPAGPAFPGALIGIPGFGTGGSWSVAAFPGPAADHSAC